MGNGQNFGSLGEQIKGAVNEALLSGDFKTLNTLVTDTVNSALADAGKPVSKAWQQQEDWKKRQESARASAEHWQKVRREREAQYAKMRSQQLAQQHARQQEMYRQRQVLAEQRRIQKTGLMVPVSKKGIVRAWFALIIGIIGAVNLFGVTIGNLDMLINYGSLFARDVLMSMISCMAFATVALLGGNKISLIRRAEQYVRLCGSKMYAGIDEIAHQIGRNAYKVRNDIRKILRKGIVPGAHMDRYGTCFMLNDVVYRQYLEAEESRVQREIGMKEQKTPSELVSEAKAQQKSELEVMISEGQAYIKQLRELNDVIEGEEISTKLFQLEDLLKEIFSRVEAEPEQMSRMHKVMDYYLPTTVKLLTAYKEFDAVSAPGADIISAKGEIEKTIDTINAAFVELLNTLFQNRVFDVTTDAQVLQTMLASEGLTKEMAFDKIEG